MTVLIFLNLISSLIFCLTSEPELENLFGLIIVVSAAVLIAMVISESPILAAILVVEISTVLWVILRNITGSK